MIKKKITLGILGLSAIGIAAYGSGAFAFQPRSGQFGPNYTPERHEQMTKAFAENDYASWKKLMADRGATRVVNQENFARFTQMHNLMLEGKYEEANKIRQELGLGNGAGQGRNGNNVGRGQNRGGNFVDANGDGTCDRMQ